MSIFALAILMGTSNLGFRRICANGAAAHGNGSVEVLLPQCGRRWWLCCSGCSAVVRVDVDGGAPDGDFPEEGEARVAAWRCPDRLFAVLTGTVSDLFCEADEELRPLRQVLAPYVMIMKR
jgi:hypothetical protein